MPNRSDATHSPQLAQLIDALRAFRARACDVGGHEILSSPELAQLDNAMGQMRVLQQLPLTSIWGEAQSLAASAEGWDLTETTGRARIERSDGTSPLPNDSAAVLHVYERAIAGSRLHLIAIRLTLGRQ